MERVVGDDRVARPLRGSRPRGELRDPGQLAAAPREPVVGRGRECDVGRAAFEAASGLEDGDRRATEGEAVRLDLRFVPAVSVRVDVAREPAADDLAVACDAVGEIGVDDVAARATRHGVDRAVVLEHDPVVAVDRVDDVAAGAGDQQVAAERARQELSPRRTPDRRSTGGPNEAEREDDGQKRPHRDTVAPVDSRRVTPSRRLSQAISEGDGISLIVPVEQPDAARAAESDGAEALLARGSAIAAIREATSLPVVSYLEAELPQGDACIVGADADWEHLHAVDVEIVVRVEQEDELEEALERHDPEIFVLAGGEDGERLERVLSLLSDVPAGKLAIAELPDVTREEIEELERAGCDAILVGGSGSAR